MSSFTANYKNEFQKLLSRKKYIVFMILGLLLNLGTFGFRFGISAISHWTIPFDVSLLPLSSLSVLSESLIPLLIFMSITDLFATEMGDKSIRAVFMRPISRFKVYSSKILAAVTYVIFIFLGVLLVFSTALAFLGNGFSVVTNLKDMIVAYITVTVPLIVLALMAVFVNQVFKSSTLVMMLCIFSYLGLKALAILSPLVTGASFVSYIGWYSLWMGNMVPFGKLLNASLILISYGIIFFAGGYYLFDKKSL